MKNNFSVNCPYCGLQNNFIGDDWRNELIDDSTTHDIECLHCEKSMPIKVDAVYTISIDDDCLEEYQEANHD